MMQVTDNALAQSDFEAIRNTLFSEQFPWYYNPTVLYEQVCSPYLDVPPSSRLEFLQCDDLDNFQFTHGFVYRGKINSSANDVLEPLYDFLEVRSLYRVKANMNPRSQNIVVHGRHLDTAWDDAKVAILYVTTDDGFTIFADGTKVESVANRILQFPSTMGHSGSTCTTGKVRVVVNVIYF